MMRSIIRGFKDPRRAFGILQKRVRAIAWRKYFHRVRPPKYQVENSYPFSYQTVSSERAAIEAALRTTPIEVNDYWLDIQSYSAYKKDICYEINYPDYTSFYGGILPNKVLQHFLVDCFLTRKPVTSEPPVYLDVASERSVAPEIYQNRHGWTVFRQDLSYPVGLNGNRLGGPASRIPLPDHSIDYIGLHCSLEHFEGEEDRLFFREAERLLKPGGRLVVAPLYLAGEDRIMTDPVVSVPNGVHFPSGVPIYCVPGWWNRFGRLYEPHTFVQRVMPELKTGKSVIVKLKSEAVLPELDHLKYFFVYDKGDTEGDGRK